mgnify:CR=1 FL=1
MAKKIKAVVKLNIAAGKANPAPPRTYNLMTAPIYTGENWPNARGQMKPTTVYVGVTG